MSDRLTILDSHIRKVLFAVKEQQSSNFLTYAHIIDNIVTTNYIRIF